MSYHNPSIPNNPELLHLLNFERRALELAKRPNVTEAQASLARFAARMARRAQLDLGRAPAASGLWDALYALGERLAAIEAPDRQPTLTLSPPKPQRNFSESIWQAEKMPVPSEWDAAE